MSLESVPVSSSLDMKSYQIKIIGQDDIEDVRNCIASSYFKDAPLTRSLNVTENCLDRKIWDQLYKNINNGLHLKAVANGKIIGICINGIMTDDACDFDIDINNFSKECQKIIKLTEHLSIQTDLFQKFPDYDEALFVKMIAVDSLWRQQGVATDLLSRCRNMALELGIGLITINCTNHFMARAAKSLDFKCIYSLKYSDYKIKSKVVLKPESPHEAVKVYATKLF